MWHSIPGTHTPMISPSPPYTLYANILDPKFPSWRLFSCYLQLLSGLSRPLLFLSDSLVLLKFLPLQLRNLVFVQPLIVPALYLHELGMWDTFLCWEEVPVEDFPGICSSEMSGLRGWVEHLACGRVMYWKIVDGFMRDRMRGDVWSLGEHRHDRFGVGNGKRFPLDVATSVFGFVA